MIVSYPGIAGAIAAAGLAYHISLTIFRFSAQELYNKAESLALTLSFVSLAVFSFMLTQNVAATNDQGHLLPTLVVIGVEVFALLYTYRVNVRGKSYKEVDLDGKVYIVTGCNTGIGFETVKALARMGATVIMACRSIDKANTARSLLLQQLKCATTKLIVLKLDLCGFDSVRKFVKSFRELGMPLHGLINNAGIMTNEITLTQDGFETVITANHLSHFLLTNLLIPDLEKTSGRVVVLTSALHSTVSKFNFDDIMSQKYYEMFYTYAQSKLANILFAKELHKRMRVRGGRVKVFSVHPGLVRTEVTRHMHWLVQALNALFAPLLSALQKTPEQGAYCSVYCASDPELVAKPDAAVGGKYFFHCQVAPESDAAQNMEAARLLWDVSAQLVGIKDDTK